MLNLIFNSLWLRCLKLPSSAGGSRGLEAAPCFRRTVRALPAGAKEALPWPAGLFSEPRCGGRKDCQWQRVSPPSGRREGYVPSSFYVRYLKAGVLYSQTTYDGVA